MKKYDILDYLYEKPSKKAIKRNKIASAICFFVLALFIAFIAYRFYETGQLSSEYWFFFLKWTTWLFLLKGLVGTIKVSLISGFVAFVLGFLFMASRISKYKALRTISVSLIEFTRGVPTLLFIYFFFLVLPAFNIKMFPILKISLPVAISASGVVAEVLRGGVNAVPKGQREAALSLGLGEVKTFLKIIFPQGFRYVIPSLIAEIVIVVKDTTFAYIVSYPDFMQNARVLISNYDALLSIYLVVAIIYILLNYAINSIATKRR